MIKFETFPVGALSCNCVLVWDPKAGTGVVVDPGDEGARIRSRVEAHGFTVTAILKTHGHFDHLGATKELQDLWGCPAHLHPVDHYFIENLDMQTGLFGMKSVPAPETTVLCPGVVYHDLKVLHTPGHSPGCCCLLGDFDIGPVLISGDTLFQGSVGRTDLWGGHRDQLEQSIRKELYVLEDRTHVLPWHGPETTIAREAATNPFVRR
jgi:glyoxylase-like metal-dependent hydrolase (beta-lactamase superfamily II)